VPFKSISVFSDFLEDFVGNRPVKYKSQVFQALRIEVNEEMKALKEMLEDLLHVLNPGARIVIISYHSLEDRLVKRFFKSGNIRGELIRDDFGNLLNPFKVLTKKIITPDAGELERNSRSRSAKMRIAEYRG